MKKYRTRGTRNGEIAVVEIIKETKKSVWVEGFSFNDSPGEPERRNKVTDFEVYHDSWGDARKYLVSKVRQEIESTERNLASRKSMLEKIELLPLRETT